MLPPLTFEEAEKIVNQSLESVQTGNKHHSNEWNKGFQAAFEWTQRRLAEFKELYVLKSSVPAPKTPEPVKPIPFKVGQTLRRTSDGLKCMIIQNMNGYVFMVQMNNGQQFAEKVVHLGKDIPPAILQQISGGYTFVTETKGREMGLAWAKEEERRTPGQMTEPAPTMKSPYDAGLGRLNNREFGGGTYSQH